MKYLYTNKHMIATLLFGALSGPAFGDASWDALTGVWHDPSNWLPVGVPTLLDDVFIGDLPAAENRTVTISQPPNGARSLTITDGMNLEVNSVLLFIESDTLVSGVNVVSVGPPDVVDHSLLLLRGNGGTERIFDTNNLTLADSGRMIVDDAIAEVDNVMTVGAESLVWGTGRFDFTQNGGTVLVNNGNFQLNQSHDPPTMVLRALNGGRFDLDGTSGNGRINLSGSPLNVNDTPAMTFQGSGLTDPFDGDVRIAGGNMLTMDFTDAWTLGPGGEINFFNGNGNVGLLSSASTLFVEGVIDVSAQAQARIDTNAGSLWFEESGNGSVSIGNGATLEITGNGVHPNNAEFTLGNGSQLIFDAAVIHAGDATFSGGPEALVTYRAGTTWPTGTTTYNVDVSLEGNGTATPGVATINAVNNVFDLDNGTDNFWILNQGKLFLNAAAINDDPLKPYTTSVGFDLPTTLTVNLTTADKWTHTGKMFISGYDFETILDGDDVELLGEYDVTGSGATFASRIELRESPGLAGLVVLVNEAAKLRLAGGDLDNPNILDLGTIVGPGTLEAAPGTALVGHGLIQAPIRFLEDAELRADDGLLQVSGELIDVGTFGTADSDGTLQVLNPWATSVTDLVEMRGGQLQGADINNLSVNGIVGHGTITAAVNNSTKIAAQGGTLVLGNINNNWDGLSGSGQLFALQGDLNLIGQAEQTGFDGLLSAGSGHEVFIVGFDMFFSEGSTTTLVENGTIRSDATQTFAGILQVFQLPATLQTSAAFLNTATNTLSDDLQLRGDTRIHAGASFTGAGDLVSHELLIFDHEASIDVALTANGKVVLEDGGVGHARVNPDASLFDILAIELAGNTPDLHDRLIVLDNLTVRGVTFDVDLFGYDPVAGDEFDVLDFTTFIDLGHTLDLPTLTPGLAWDSSDFVTQGVLRVVPEPTTVGLLALGMAPLLRRRRAAQT